MEWPPSSPHITKKGEYGYSPESGQTFVPSAIKKIIREHPDASEAMRPSPECQQLAKQLVGERTSYSYPTVYGLHGEMVIIGDKCGSEQPNDWCVVVVSSEAESSDDAFVLPDIISVSRLRRDCMKGIANLLPDGVNERIQILTKYGQDYYIDIYNDLSTGACERDDHPYRMVVWRNDRNNGKAEPFLASWKLPTSVSNETTVYTTEAERLSAEPADPADPALEVAA